MFILRIYHAEMSYMISGKRRLKTVTVSVQVVERWRTLRAANRGLMPTLSARR